MKQTPEQEMEELQPFLDKMEEVMLGVVAAYEQLVGRSDALALAMGLDHATVLGKVLPLRAMDRRDVTRIEKWFHKECLDAAKGLFEEQEELRREQEREDLIASLGLTDYQKSLLFEQE